MKYQIKILLSIILPVFLSCLQDEGTQDPVIAQVGHERISYSDFKRDFLLNPRYVVRTPMRVARDAQLKSMIRDKYYYLAARSIQLEKDSLVQKRMEYIYKNELRRFYLQEKFLDKIILTPVEIENAYQKASKKYRIQNLYAVDEKSAQEILDRIEGGESFEIIAPDIYNNEDLKNSGGDVGFVTFGDLDQNVEDVIYSMSINQNSEPIKSHYGYHIIRVLDIKQNEEFNDLNLAMKMSMISKILKNRKATVMISEYLNNITKGQKIQINNHLIEVLYTISAKIFREKYDGGNLLQPPIQNRELTLFELSVKDIKNDIVARYDDVDMTVEDFLIRLREMPPYHRPQLDTRRRLMQSIIDIIRDDIFYAQAEANRLYRNSEFKITIEKLNEELLSSEFRRRLHDPQFKEGFPESWIRYEKVLRVVEENNKVTVYDEILFKDIANPDSVMAPTPIQVFLKSAYNW